MASGFGLHGGQGRCYKYWMEFSECMNTAMDPKECRSRREDYMECLHHRKEYQRYQQIAAEKAKQEAGGSGHARGH